MIPVYMFLISLGADGGSDCCNDAWFAGTERIGIMSLTAFCLIAYAISLIRPRTFPPVPELVLNILLVIGILLSCLLSYHVGYDGFGILITVFGFVPIIFFLLIMIAENHQLHLDELNGIMKLHSNSNYGLVVRLLVSKSSSKASAILVLCAPFLLIYSSVLYVFGQKPDTLIRAFTETYHLGFSQLTYLCEKATCSGHYLCTVGAKGHSNIVKPLRVGVRHKKLVICNRQLLISNAFEELIFEKFPILHRTIRKQYDKVGDFVERKYHLFEIKIVSDIVYILMKPLEWIFLISLYCLDKKPENRISSQYLTQTDRSYIQKELESLNDEFLDKPAIY